MNIYSEWIYELHKLKIGIVTAYDHVILEK